MSKEYKKTRKDRKDARWVQMPGMMRLCTYIKERRDADVYICKKIDVTNLVKYMEKKKKEDKEITYFHAFSLAFAKVIYNRPKLNRFILGNECYEHDKVSLGFVAKVDFTDEAKEFMSTFNINEGDNIVDVKNTIKEIVKNIRGNQQSDTDDSLDILNKFPRWMLRKIVMPLIFYLDRHDRLPASLTNNLIYYSSAIVSNLGAIKCGAIYHNITDLGTSSSIVCIGEIHKEPVVDEKGKVVAHDVVEFGINLDERIADGAYFAKSANLLEYIIAHPETLDDRADTIYHEKDKLTY